MKRGDQAKLRIHDKLLVIIKWCLHISSHIHSNNFIYSVLRRSFFCILHIRNLININNFQTNGRVGTVILLNLEKEEIKEQTNFLALSHCRGCETEWFWYISISCWSFNQLHSFYYSKCKVTAIILLWWICTIKIGQKLAKNILKLI